MKIMNYMNLNQHSAQLSFRMDRTQSFTNIYHAHQGMELLYVHQGHGQVIVNQQISQLGPGSLVFFRPYQLHRLQMELGPEDSYVRSLFVFEPSELERYIAPFPSLRSFFHRLLSDPLEQQVITGLPQPSIERLFEDWNERMAMVSPKHEIEEKMLFLISFLQFLKFHRGAGKQEEPLEVRKASVAERVMQWVEEHYMEEFHLKKLAEEVHLTPNHVSAVFSRSVGTSISEYLTARRIRQACLLLRTSDLSVQEVGQAVGLSNAAYFCSLFRKNVGVTPYRYKRAND
jgi:AraC family transcriptional regulator, arabinose operon regulatory protein